MTEYTKTLKYWTLIDFVKKARPQFNPAVRLSLFMKHALWLSLILQLWFCFCVSLSFAYFCMPFVDKTLSTPLLFLINYINILSHTRHSIQALKIRIKRYEQYCLNLGVHQITTVTTYEHAGAFFLSKLRCCLQEVNVI